jgi:hypothetical protein
LEGNSIWKEIGRKYCYKEGNEKEILFYLIISKNKAIFIQFCANLVPRVLFLRLYLGGGRFLSVGRKNPRGFLCVCPERRDAINSYGISFRTHSKVAPNYYAFCPPGAKMSWF